MILVSKRIVTFLVCACILFADVTLASSNKLEITSDNLTVKKDQLTATFNGYVTVTFDDLKLTTSKLTIFYTDITDERKIKKIVIPFRLRAIKNCGKEIIIADKGIFDNLTKKLTLEGNVKIQKEGNILATNKLVYSAYFKGIHKTTEQKNNAE